MSSLLILYLGSDIMIKIFDNSKSMMEDIMEIDKKSFKDIDVNVDTLCERIKKNTQYELFIKYEKIFQLHI